MFDWTAYVTTRYTCESKYDHLHGKMVYKVLGCMKIKEEEMNLRIFEITSDGCYSLLSLFLVS